METLNVPQGEYPLAIYPARPKQPLRAWDAADEYLLSELAATLDNHAGENHPQPPRLLILNDGFGALSTALSDLEPQSLSDSYLSHRGITANLELNGIPTDHVSLLNSLEKPEGHFDIVLIKIPKSLAYLEDQLHRIRPHIKPDTLILGAAMVKGIHTSTLQLFERILGSTTTSLARRKARLIYCTPDLSLNPGSSPYPKHYHLGGSDARFSPHPITQHANVFSRGRLDIGTRFLLEHLPVLPGARQIIDLGCGNGIVGLMAAQQHPKATLTFIDESFMAVASARATFQAAFSEDREVVFRVADCLEGIGPGSVDLILNNPPFHQQQVVGDQIAWQMFLESKQVLRPGGELWVVGNRHLGYHTKLKRLFGQCTTVAGNQKFVILRAVKG
jgi:16S rRNA (guanine1207-N2)-methyltransferase